MATKPRPCNICLSPDRRKYEAAFLSAGEPYTPAIRFGLDEGEARRHWQHHMAGLRRMREINRQKAASRSISKTLVTTLEEWIRRSDDLWNKLKTLFDEAVVGSEEERMIAIRASQAVAQQTRELRELVELLAKLTGQMEPREQGAGPVTIIIPQMVPVGSPANLQAALPESRARLPVAEIVDVKAEEAIEEETAESG